MKLQLALDRLTRNQCFSLIEETADTVDIIEVGTGVIKEYGMEIVREIRSTFPGKVLLADMKTCDAGKHEALQAFQAGAEIVTAMSFAADQTIADMLEVAEEFGGKVLIDLLNCSDPSRVQSLYELGARHFCIHIGKDTQANNTALGSRHFDLVRDLKEATIYAAGGLNLESTPYLDSSIVDVAIIGSAITTAADPGAAALAICNVLKDI